MKEYSTLLEEVRVSSHEQSQKQDEAIARLASSIAAYRAGALTAEQLRPLRLAMGLYAQLPQVKHMQRVKIPGGVLLADQVDAIADVTSRFGRSVAHVTTRQDIQIHFLELEDAVEVQSVLARAGVTTVGACADSVRNVTSSPYGGVLPGDSIDTAPYAHAITQHFLFHELNLRLPRKFKIAVSGEGRDDAQAMINDLGIVVERAAHRVVCRVFVGGGLGSTPEIAHPWLVALPVEDLLIACEAVVRVYHRDGERKNRKKNRLKFLLRSLGEAELLARLQRELDALSAERGEALRGAFRRWVADFHEPSAPPPAAGPTLGDSSFSRWQKTNAAAQLQPGYHSVTVTLPLGDATADQLRGIARLSCDFGNGAVRTTNTQNLVLRWIPSAKLLDVYRALSALGLGEPDAHHVTDIVACPGADYCSLAITKSMGVATRIREHLAPNRLEADDLIQRLGRFEIKISGCPNACGQHQVGDIGMTGLMVTGKDGIERAHYSFRLGGGCGPGARVGARLSARVPEEQAPAMIARMARHYLDRRAEGESFRDFVLRVGADAIGAEGLKAAPGAL